MENFDLTKLSAADLAKLLAQAKAVEKERAEEIAALPTFAFLCVMEDSKLVYWSGKAEDEESAKKAAIAYAEESNSSGVFDLCKRPMPKPRGRKAKVQEDATASQDEAQAPDSNAPAGDMPDTADSTVSGAPTKGRKQA